MLLSVIVIVLGVVAYPTYPVVGVAYGLLGIVVAILAYMDPHCSNDKEVS